MSSKADVTIQTLTPATLPLFLQFFDGKTARTLLDAACEGLRQQGMTIAEANPRRHAKTAAENHFGPLALYLSSGFNVHREDADGNVFVRRSLVGDLQPVRREPQQSTLWHACGLDTPSPTIWNCHDRLP